MIYVGCAEDSTYDQLLEEVLVGPIPIGINKFVLQTKGPDPLKIKNEDLIGVTVILLTCSYCDQEFVRIGYYVSNEYSEPFEPESPPNPVEISKLFRNILANEPRVTRFAIVWNGVPIENNNDDNGIYISNEEETPEDMDAVNEDAMDDDEDDEDDEDEEDIDVNAEVDLGDEDEEDDEGIDEE